jgi:hypothetical protein
MNHLNRNCLKLETRKYDNGMFQKSVDATYIVHLENNGRLHDINKQLELFHPTNTVYIVFNKGYTKCNKILIEQTPPHDLIDTFLFIFKDSNEKGYKNILILEDDFIFTEKIYQSNHLTNINDFLNQKKEEKFLYYLGCLLWLQLPYNEHTVLNLISTGSHSIIYSYSARQDLLEKKKIPIYDWDIYNNLFTGNTRYVYKEPLCYQLCPITENSKHWKTFFNIDLSRMYINYAQLDVKIENGYSNTYIFSKILGYILIILFLLLLFFTGKYLFKMLKMKKIMTKSKINRKK